MKHKVLFRFFIAKYSKTYILKQISFPLMVLWVGWTQMGSSPLGCLMGSQMVTGLQSSEDSAELDVQENLVLARTRSWLWAGSSAGAVDYIAHA